MARTSDWVEMELVVTVKAYPTVSQTYREAVCVAGVRLDTPEPEWIRLYPVAFRDLARKRQFEKWEVIRLRAAKHSTDRRRETWRPDTDSIVRVRKIAAGGHWPERRMLLEPLFGRTMCELHRGRLGGRDGPSLGVVPVAEMLSLIAEEAGGWSPEQIAVLSQGSLIGKDKKLLEKPGHTFFYRWLCQEPGCRGHRQSIVDWELGQAYRRWQRSGLDPVEAIRTKWGEEICSSERELFLFVGDQHQHPGAFLILGAFWPRFAPDRNQLALSFG